MAQKIWKINPDSPTERTIGIYHGEESGHLILYIDQRILMIKFNQKEEKTYSFYLENFLYELKIKTEKEEKFSYHLINKSKELELDYYKKLSFTQKIKYWFTN